MVVLIVQIEIAMNHTEIIEAIIKVLPELKEEFKEPYKMKNSLMVMNVFTKRIKELIIKGDKKTLYKCIRKINEFYTKGNQALKTAIETVFIFSLNSLTHNCEMNYKRMIFQKITIDLRIIHLYQSQKNGI